MLKNNPTSISLKLIKFFKICTPCTHYAADPSYEYGDCKADNMNRPYFIKGGSFVAA